MPGLLVGPEFLRSHRARIDALIRETGADLEPVALPNDPAARLAARDLAEQTLVVVGLGGIGSEIARLARALGMHVIGVRRHAPPGDSPAHEWVAPARLHRVLPRAHWLAVACPLSDETRGWLDGVA